MVGGMTDAGAPAQESTVEETRRKLAGALLTGSLALGVIVAVALAAAAIIKKPDLEGVLAGLFGGAFLGLIVAVAGAWASISLMLPKAKPDPNAGADIEASLQDVLGELEKARLNTVAQVNKRATWRVPACIAGGAVLWVLGQFSDDPGDLMDLIALMIVPGIGGYVWASMKLSSEYAQLYKQRVLPRLAASFGDISYRRAAAPDLTQLEKECIFGKFDRMKADDEIFGMHRNLPLNLVELKLERQSGKNDQVVFDGLLVTLTLPRDTGAVTAVVSDAGAWGNFTERMKSQHRERVRLEDPRFEKVYEVYGADQIAARALLNPAFMERFMALGDLPDFSLPFLLCSGRMLQIAMPKRFGRDLFEPPSFQKPAANREALVKLQADIAAVMAAADAVIDLDHRFEVMARR